MESSADVYPGMYVYLRTCIGAWIRVYSHTSIRGCTRAQVRACRHAKAPMYMCVPPCLRLHTPMSILASIHAFIYACQCIS
jgi:hypothetical protein